MRPVQKMVIRPLSARTVGMRRKKRSKQPVISIPKYGMQRKQLVRKPDILEIRIVRTAEKKFLPEK